MNMEDDLPVAAVSVPCRICGEPCCRSMVTDEWVHSDDEIVYRGLERVSTSYYDHQARPDIIDSEPERGDTWLPRRR